MTFSDLGLPAALVSRLAAVGYEAPSPIQAATIPALMEGRDVLGTAQTGTGKTAAFALPAIARLRPDDTRVQVLVLTPTRELAIQVAEAFQSYASDLPGFRVLPIYGGQPYGPQLQGLRRGVQVVVGTPGRVKDHLERGTLSLDAVQAVVLDEADEMLRMGFVEEVDIILSRAPATRQVALFSATMPSSVRRIAQTHLKDPVEVNIAAKTRTAADVTQRYWYVAGTHKMEALTRILEAETFDAMIIFARTKAMTTELAEKLQARGFAAAALNGDMPQSERERTVERLKNRQLDIAVATDVAARGLDVERISHVLNYDIPTDTESYIHRIGRTGRAGRSGEAILFVAPREKHLLRLIEKATRQPITEMRLPTVAAVNAKRMDKFKQSIADTLASGGSDAFRPILEDMVREQGVSLLDIACALAAKAQGKTPLLMSPEAEIPSRPPQRDDVPARPARDRQPGEHSNKPRPDKPRPSASRPAAAQTPEEGMARYRIEVGRQHGVQPGQIVGAIANEADIDSQYIGRIEIADDYSFVDLPEDMPKAVQKVLAKAWVCGQRLQIRQVEAASSVAATPYKPKFDGKSKPQHKASTGKPDFKPGAKKFTKKPGPPRS
jgi:ATP-dependent RNA helicase DeaD